MFTWISTDDPDQERAKRLSKGLAAVFPTIRLSSMENFCRKDDVGHGVSGCLRKNNHDGPHANYEGDHNLVELWRPEEFDYEWLEKMAVLGRLGVVID